MGIGLGEEGKTSRNWKTLVWWCGGFDLEFVLEEALELEQRGGERCKEGKKQRREGGSFCNGSCWQGCLGSWAGLIATKFQPTTIMRVGTNYTEIATGFYRSPRVPVGSSVDGMGVPLPPTARRPFLGWLGPAGRHPRTWDRLEPAQALPGVHAKAAAAGA